MVLIEVPKDVGRSRAQRYLLTLPRKGLREQPGVGPLFWMPGL